MICEFAMYVKNYELDEDDDKSNNNNKDNNNKTNTRLKCNSSKIISTLLDFCLYRIPVS